jgi:hypothetical protein
MYRLTAADREPLTLFGRTYYWSPNDAGRLHLISLARLAEAVKALQGESDG